MKYLKLIVLSGLISAGLAQASDQKEDPRAAAIALQVAIRKLELAARTPVQVHAPKVSKKTCFFDDSKVEEHARISFQKNMAAAYAWMGRVVKNQRHSSGRGVAAQPVQVEYEFDFDNATGAVSIIRPLANGTYETIKTFR